MLSNADKVKMCPFESLDARQRHCDCADCIQSCQDLWISPELYHRTHITPNYVTQLQNNEFSFLRVQVPH